MDTMAPKVDLLESIITDKTVALLLAHIYGKWFDTRPFLEVAKKRDIKVITVKYFLNYYVCYNTFCVAAGINMLQI